MVLSNASWAMTMLVLALCFMPAADVTGKWKGISDTGREIAFDLKADGQKLTGTVAIGQGKEQAISDGKVEGDSISFSMPSLYGGSYVDRQRKARRR